jgi:EAL domain-containing protein (putative c-di-GMP-specific phosphodiesterase class I)
MPGTDDNLLENAHQDGAAVPQVSVALEDVWRAIEGDQFLPYFQPKVTLRGMELAGVEALMRWNHPQHGMLTAGAFLPLIADNFLFDELSALMLEKSVAQCREWLVADLDVPVSVNLSPDLLRDANIVERLSSVMRQHKLAEHRLVVELPEAAVAHDADDLLENLEKLRALGFGLAIDDFGTGRILPDQLARVPATELKIDRKMLAGPARPPPLRTLLERAMQTAHQLGLRAVAEGVETREEWELINALGCDMAQGYFIARPMAGVELPGWTELWRADPFV